MIASTEESLRSWPRQWMNSPEGDRSHSSIVQRNPQLLNEMWNLKYFHINFSEGAASQGFGVQCRLWYFSVT